MRASLLISLTIILVFTVQGQTVESGELEVLRIKGGYFAESVVHPGLSIGVERNITYSMKSRYNDRIENHKRRKKTKLSEVYWGASINGFYHPNNETMWWLTAELGFQRSTSRGFMLGAELGAGFGRSFHANPTYQLIEYQDGPNIESVPMAGYGGFVPSAFLYLGWNEFLRKNGTWGFRVGPTVYGRLPYNHFEGASIGLNAELVLYNLLMR